MTAAPAPTLLLLAALAGVGCHAPVTSQAPPPTEFASATETFDLLVYGYDLDAGDHELFLRTNLDLGGEWVSIGTAQTGAADGRWSTLVFTGLRSTDYLGQDFRERYLDLKIVTRDGADGARVSAVYAMPHIQRIRYDPERLSDLIENHPTAVEDASIASHVQPTPAVLGAGRPHVEHVRAPMKHTRPGVAEVEQLQVEWRNRGY